MKKKFETTTSPTPASAHQRSGATLVGCTTRHGTRNIGHQVGVGAVLVVALLLLVAGCQTAPEAGGVESDLTQVYPGVSENPIDAPLREGDEISITCENVTNLNTKVKIPLSGFITLPFIEPVRAVGKSPAELQKELIELYRPQVRAEVITVRLENAESSVYVSGAVLQPGKLPLDRHMTALDAIMEAGGPDPKKARLSKVVVLREENGQRVSYPLNLNQAVKGKPGEPFYLKPFDKVQVPYRQFNW